MNKNVNVLAVMDDYPDLLDFAAIHYGSWASDCKGAYIASPHVIESLARARKARAAVAELIEEHQLLLDAVKRLPATDGRVIGLIPLIARSESALSRAKGV